MKKILFIISIILVFLAGGLFYINKMLLPVHIKGLLLRAAQEQLKGRAITLGSLNYNPLKGIVLTDLVITAKNNPTKAFIQINEVSAQILLLPLFQKKIIISSLHIEDPVIRLIRLEEATWNFSDLIPGTTPSSANEKPPFEILLSGLAFTNGQILIDDRMSETSFTETLSPVNLKGSLTLSKDLHAAAVLTGNIGIASSQGSIKFDARVGIADKTLKGTLRTQNMNVEQYLRFIPSGSGKPILPAAIKRLTIGTIDLQILQSSEGLTISGNGQIPELDISQKDTAMIQGQLAFNKLFIFISSSGTITAQGDFSSEKLNAALPNEQHAQGKLGLHLSKLTVDKTMIDGAGSFQGDNLDILMNGVAFTGNVQTTQTTLLLKDNVLTGSSDLSAQHALLSLGKEIRASGDIRMDAASFRLANGLISADGNATINGASLAIGETLRVAGDLTLPKASLRPSDNGMLITTDASLKNARITLTPEQTISGNILLSNMTCALSGTDMTIDTAADLQGITIDTPAAHVTTSLNADKLKILWKNKILDANADIAFKKLSVTLPKSLTFTGSPFVSVHVTLDPAQPSSLAYDGKAELNDGHISDVPSVGTINDINTAVTLKTNELTFSALTLNTMNTPLTMSGKVENFADPYLSVDVKADRIDLELVRRFIPDLLEQEQISLSGNAALTAHFTGRPSKPLDAKILARVTLTDTNIKSRKLKQELTSIHGLLIYETPQLSWQDLHVTWEKRDIALNGTLENFDAPLVSGSVKTDDLAADFIIEKKTDVIAVKQLKGTYLGSSVDLLGSVGILPNSAPEINMAGTAKVALRDLPKFLPAQAKQIDDLKLEGAVKLTFKTKGKTDDWQHLRSSFTLETPALGVMGYQIENLSISSEQRDGKLDPMTITAAVYGGRVNATNDITLTDTTFPFDSSFKIETINIAEIKKATPALSKQELSGLFSAVGNIKGKALDIQNMEGKTVFSVREGYLWGVQALEGLMKILASSFQNNGSTTITEADATLDFGQKRIMTEDLVLKSEAVTIKGQGWIDWDQNIEFSVSPELRAPAPTENVGSIISLINPTAGLMNIRVYGKLSAPKIEHNLSAPTLIKKTLQNTVGGLLKLFE